MTVTTREQTSDKHAEPLVWYVYILELQDGDFYIGQTNDMKTRLAEHSMGAGADATSGNAPKLVWVNMASSRDAARRMESRLQRAKNRNPAEVRKVVADFQGLVRLYKPDKTLKELEQEERDYEFAMVGSYHYFDGHMMPPPGVPRLAVTACGWNLTTRGGWGDGKAMVTQDWQELAFVAAKYTR